MTKIDKIVKIDNSTNDEPIAFVPKGQNFTYTVDAGETLEFKVRNSSDALYYVVNDIPGATVSTQSSFDSDGGLTPFPDGYSAKNWNGKIKFNTELTKDEVDSLLQQVGVDLGNDVALFGFQIPGRTSALLDGKWSNPYRYLDLVPGIMHPWSANPEDTQSGVERDTESGWSYSTESG